VIARRWHRHLSLHLTIALLISALASGQTPRSITATLVKVIDGDTIGVRIGDRVERVRYIGINAPEVHHATKGEQPGGREATASVATGAYRQLARRDLHPLGSRRLFTAR